MKVEKFSLCRRNYTVSDEHKSLAILTIFTHYCNVSGSGENVTF